MLLNSITFFNFLFVLFELYLLSVSKLFSSGFPGPLEESSWIPEYSDCHVKALDSWVLSSLQWQTYW